jgi:DNA (cytosine-5)-methyltransferase 1
MTAYYNEIDSYAAQWLRNLIVAGHIAPGDVDERSIEDVRPDELDGYTQCHFFAGIGVWSYALRLAGWPDDRPIWTGSCPCQPFSSAGKGNGFADERHLWPAFYHLIEQCRPAIVFGEQVASKDADAWLDLVSTDMEALGSAFGAVAFPSAGIGAPHVRDRTYWMAYAGSKRRDWINALLQPRRQDETGPEVAGCSQAGELADSERERICACGPGCVTETPRGMQGADRERERVRTDPSANHDIIPATTGPTNGFWRTADWLLCRDEKWRPVEPGTFPLAHGAPARVGRLRAYGNAINAEAARAFIEVAMDCLP